MRWTLLGLRPLETLACVLSLNGCAVHVVQTAGPSEASYVEAPRRVAAGPTWTAPAPPPARPRPARPEPAPARPAPAQPQPTPAQPKPVALAPAPRPLHELPGRPSSSPKPASKPRFVIRKPRLPEAPPVRPYDLVATERTATLRQPSTGVAKPQ